MPIRTSACAGRLIAPSPFAQQYRRFGLARQATGEGVEGRALRVVSPWQPRSPGAGKGSLDYRFSTRLNARESGNRSFRRRGERDLNMADSEGSSRMVSAGPGSKRGSRPAGNLWRVSVFIFDRVNQEARS